MECGRVFASLEFQQVAKKDEQRRYQLRQRLGDEAVSRVCVDTGIGGFYLVGKLKAPEDRAESIKGDIEAISYKAWKIIELMDNKLNDSMRDALNKAVIIGFLDATDGINLRKPSAQFIGHRAKDTKHCTAVTPRLFPSQNLDFHTLLTADKGCSSMNEF
ncbi:GL24028 [Drosophila persimilis]|uniref:GL24028 n=1 Tax=Drosophila persimilis TaxID=7234 RepID=B4G342_DROPE|nr:GL24028 [Drosophila persimilis]